MHEDIATWCEEAVAEAAKTGHSPSVVVRVVTKDDLNKEPLRNPSEAGLCIGGTSSATGSRTMFLRWFLTEVSERVLVSKGVESVLKPNKFDLPTQSEEMLADAYLTVERNREMVTGAVYRAVASLGDADVMNCTIFFDLLDPSTISAAASSAAADKKA
jgi:hypothetical protein